MPLNLEEKAIQLENLEKVRNFLLMGTSPNRNELTNVEFSDALEKIDLVISFMEKTD